ncbi:hypothetical protein C6P40_000938 [Pichia californica]|uniref:Mediator of RNA polymerase II transcription subunit 9 n=1 Tax=Pichia californica TaxID=460514 RepID=A0A9P7BH51_9ASCO|nr:hypothetical protein C6P42_002352 [[Candida] californica]KAG0690856.1 hypothetical protein C6P40_000938 [[Candida] californica]
MENNSLTLPIINCNADSQSNEIELSVPEAELEQTTELLNPVIVTESTTIKNQTQSQSQSQSPISISGSDSVAGISASITPIPGLTPSHINGPSLSIDQVFSDHKEKEEGEKQGVQIQEEGLKEREREGEGEGKNSLLTSVTPASVIVTSAIEDHNDKMDVDEDVNVNVNEGEELKDLEGSVKDSEENHRFKKLEELQNTLENMEKTRLELIPLLLETVEQVKNGELAIRDVDNACGRIRLRINRLQESRTLVKNELSKLEENRNGMKLTKQETEQRIKIKSDAITSILGSINAWKS